MSHIDLTADQTIGEHKAAIINWWPAAQIWPVTRFQNEHKWIILDKNVILFPFCVQCPEKVWPSNKWSGFIPGAFRVMQRVRKFLLWFPKESRSGGVKVQKDHQSTRPNKERGREESWGFTFHRAAAAAEQTELSSSVFSRQLYLMSALPSNHNSPPSLFSLLCLPFSHALCFLTYANSQQKDLCSTSHQPPAVLFSSVQRYCCLSKWECGSTSLCYIFTTRIL